VETIHADNSGKEFYSYRSVVYFDKQTHLPVRVETYYWPKPGTNPNGELMESYSYINMRVNVGLGDESFNY
jgi:negative regulator of sigma E activity